LHYCDWCAPPFTCVSVIGEWSMSSAQYWGQKEIIKRKTKEKALKDLLKENSVKTKTKDIVFEDLELSDYLKENKNTTL